MRQIYPVNNLPALEIVSMLEVPTSSGEPMKLSKYFYAGLFALVLSVGNPVFAQGNGHGKGHDKHHKDDDDRDDHYYRHHEKEIRGWYSENEDHLPPGLAKKGQLERQLPPPPPETRHVLVGGNIVLLNRKTNVVVDIFPF